MRGPPAVKRRPAVVLVLDGEDLVLCGVSSKLSDLGGGRDG